MAATDIDDLFDPSTARNKLEFIQKDVLRDVRHLVERLEGVARQVDGSVKQLQTDRAAAKTDMNSIALQLVKAAEAQQGQEKPTAAVSLTQEGQAAVVGAVDHALKLRTPALVKALAEAEPSAFGEVKTEIQKLARVQAALVQQQEQSGVDWARLWPVVAACVASAVISGLLVGWLVKPAPAVRQDLTLESGQKIDAGKQEQR